MVEARRHYGSPSPAGHTTLRRSPGYMRWQRYGSIRSFAAHIAGQAAALWQCCKPILLMVSPGATSTYTAVFVGTVVFVGGIGVGVILGVAVAGTAVFVGGIGVGKAVAAFVAVRVCFIVVGVNRTAVALPVGQGVALGG